MSHHQANLNIANEWLTKHAIAPSGAILYGDNQIRPYFSNLAAIGLLRNPNLSNLVIVGNWMRWYLAHWNYKPADKWGLVGTIYDFDYDPSSHAEKSRDNCDSTDSYAATFLSLAWAFYSSGNENVQRYIHAQKYPLDVIGGVIKQTINHDLTWAKPDYHVKYLMDNCEVYRGLRDLSALWAALNEPRKAEYYNAVADPMLKAINSMWLGDAWESSRGEGEPNLKKWYPDAVAQLFPVLMGVVDPKDPRAQSIYAKFCDAWPGWPQMSFSTVDSFPWVLVACAAALMGDTPRVDAYLLTIEQGFQREGFPWPWYSMEAGWYMRLNAYMLGHRPL